MADDLMERLKENEKALEGLMSLIPAERYYGKDTSDQWQRKKLTKEERRKAKKAKLNPENHKSAMDIMDENNRKRKWELERQDNLLDYEASKREKSIDGLKLAANRAKKQKLGVGCTKSVLNSSRHDITTKAQLAREIGERSEGREQKTTEDTLQRGFEETEMFAEDIPGVAQQDNDVEEINDAEEPGESIEKIDTRDINGNSHDQQSAVSSPSASASPVSGTLVIPSTSSLSSIVPPATSSSSKLPIVDPEILRARLHARLQELRATRKADGIDGARNRQELIEARRRKQEQRRAHKKEMRQKAKEEEQRAAAEVELARLRGSGSPLSVELEHNFAFGRVVFDDGQRMDSTGSALLDTQKKGPSDPRTALEAAKKKQARINGLDDAKRVKIEEKDAWLNAKKKAHGEKVRDNVSLLKKTLKRKEKAKQKSEREWKERITGVEKSKEIKQRRREENLRKRKEEKGGKKGKKLGKKGRGRPGFEGSFTSKAR